MLFAYSYPFSLNDIDHSIRRVQNKFLASDYAYFNKKTLVNSVEGRPMHMLTLASQDAFLAKKPVVFLTCRVHCGETPAQYML
jgi:hypothetical protein